METEGVKKEGSDVPVMRRVRFEDQFIRHYSHWYGGDDSLCYECRTCGRIAYTEHNAPECHVCSDWGGCHDDCTLSRVYCRECGVEAVLYEA